MSRLDSFIRRMAQRDILNAAAPLVLPQGGIREIGLGSGRACSHLRDPCPLRRIVATAFVGKGTALVHADIGTGYPVKDAETLTWLPAPVGNLAAPDVSAISGLPLATPKLSPLELPQGIQSGRYFLYRESA